MVRMPTSRPDHLSWLCNKVIELRPQSILDLGFGFGSKGMLFREYADVWFGNYFGWKTRIDGVEVFKEYIGDLQRIIYDNIYNEDIATFVDKMDYYDLIYMGDVLEHFEKEEGKVVLEKLKKKSRCLIISTPVKVLSQGDVYGNVNETHKSQWTPEDFPGCEIATINNIMLIVYNRPCIYYCDGMKFYGDRSREYFKFNSYNIHDKCLFMGLYFDRDYEVFKNHKGERFVFWNGSDVSRLLDSPGAIDIVRNTPAVHACHNKALQDELASVGVSAIIRPILFTDVNDYGISYSPSDKLQFYINAHPQREHEYGIDTVLKIAPQFPNIKFHIYGIEGQSKDNVVYHGFVQERYMDREVRQYQGCLRLNRHDGLSQLVIKAGLMGQYIITMQDTIGTIKISDTEGLVSAIKEVATKKEPNLEFREYYLDKLNNFDWL
jgi:hypothetical protein